MLLSFMLAAGLCAALSPVLTPSAAASGSSASLAPAAKLEAILFGMCLRLCVCASSSALTRIIEIIGDCDGVLADTERDGHRLAFNRAFAKSQIDEEWSVERYGKLLETGGGKERMIAHWEEVGFPPSMPILGRYEKVANLHAAKTTIFNELIGEGAIPLRSGVLRLVDEAIARGVRLAVCSTSNERAVTNLVDTLMGPERAAKFQIFAGDVVPNKKPAPDIYLLALESMGLNKDRCVIIEDSHIGCKAAVASGVSCLVTKSSYTADEDFTGAKLIVDELGDDEPGAVTVSTLESLLPGALEGSRKSWAGARYVDPYLATRRAYPTPSSWHE